MTAMHYFDKFPMAEVCCDASGFSDVFFLGGGGLFDKPEALNKVGD